MTSEMQALLVWVQVCLIVAGFCATLFLLVYSFTGWYKYPLGRLIWIQALGFALAIDLTVLFQFWTPSNIMVLFWTNVTGFTLIAGASAALTIMLFKTHLAYKKKEKDDNVQRLRAVARGE